MINNALQIFRSVLPIFYYLTYTNISVSKVYLRFCRNSLAGDN